VGIRVTELAHRKLRIT